MSEGLKARFDFPSPIIQAQTVRTLVAAVLKEKAPNERISSQGAAMGALWEQCCSDCAPVRSACCDALVLLVEQGHADLQHIMDTILNLMPSARNVQGLIKVTGRLLQMQADQRDTGAPYTCPYSIRGSPHPYITALENRVDCWPVLLLEVEDYIQEAVDRDEPVYVDMLEPFLRYLYCQPQRPAQQALLRHGLLRVLLPAWGEGGGGGEESPPPFPRVSERLLRCLYHMVPHMQVDSVEAVLELHGFLQTLLPAVVRAPGRSWRAEGARLALQLLCACHVSLRLDGSCGPPVSLLRQLLPACKEELPVEELLVGLSLLLLEASAPQQTSLLTLALSLVPEDSERCPWGTPVLTLPLLQMLACSALTEPLADPRTHRRNHGLAHSLLRSAQKPTQSYTEGGVCLSSPLSGWYSEVQVVVHVLRRVLGSASAASDWLLSVMSSLTSSSSSGGSPPRPPAALGLVVAHLIVGGPPDVCRLALRAAQAIGVADPSQVPSLLPVLLFRLGKESDPSVCHALLSSLPHMGTHKLCVPQVLHILQMLASDPKLRAVAMRLMTALWVKQDRVYPDLQRVLLGQQEKWTVVLGKDTQWELILARAACIRDICTERPYQHGGDMLAAIAHTLSQNTKPDLASPAALALQGLTQLCRAEVVDLVSTWRALGPKLSGDRRPLVVKAVSELLALVHQLTAKGQDYQKLKDEIVSFLWSYALSKECEVSSSGYRALSSFPEDSHTVLHLPEPARPVKLPTDEDEEEEEEEEGKEKEEDLSVPGLSYVKLLTLTPSPVLPALEIFVTSLVRQEMERMPRGVYHSALRGAGLRSDQGKTLAGVPAFMLKTYEKNKQPGLKPGLAAGLLLSYDLPVQTDRDGRSLPRFLLARSRSFQQTLTALIHEVNIQPSEWHRALLLPQAWRAFMNRAFHAVLQGRRGELEMAQKQGKGSPEDLQYKHHCAWLCARDQLTDVLKSAAKDSPVVQGNSILALSGLAAVVAKYESNLPLDPDGSLGVGPEVVPTSSWLSMVLDTLLSVINSSYKARGQVFPWFIHRSYSGENTASAIARSCAALALCLVVPVLSGWHREGVSEVLATLRAGLPGQPTADDSQAVQFHSGLALGMVLSAMHRERLSEVSAQKDADLLTTSLDSLESCSFNPSLEYNAGCVLGMGLVLGSLSSSGQSEHGVRVVLTLDKLLVSLRDSGGQGRMLQEVLSYSVACVVVSAFRAGLVDAGKAEEVMNTLRGLTEDNQQTAGFSLSLGLVVHGLAACGHGKAEDIHPRLLAAWVKILLAEGCPTMQRLAAVNGLVALVGSESYVIQLKTETELSSQQQGRLNEVIRSMTQIISFSGAIGLQSNSACLVGHLHLAHMTCSHSHTAVPQDFSYLPEKSLIRSIIQYVSEAGKKGPECTRPAVVRVALACLASVGSTFQYPPVNWSAILSPLMRLNFGQDTQHQCAVLAASQVQTSQSASLFLGSWLSPPLVHSLSYETRGCLYESLSTWMKHVSEDKLQVFVESQGVALFQEDTRALRRSLCLALLRGLAQAMALPNPPSTVWAVLRSTAEKIFSLMPDHIQVSDVELYEGITKCLSELPDTEIDRITQVTQTNMEKSCLVLTSLTSRGRVPLLGLNDVIAAVLRGWPSHGVGGLLPHTFYQCRLASPGPNTGVSKRMEWLLELMGHIRNIVYGSTSVQCSITQATDFLLQVFAGAVAAWGDHSMPLLLGMRANWFPREEEEKEEAGGSKPPCLPHRPYGEENLTTHSSLPLTKTPLSPTREETHLSVCLLGLSHSLPQLLSKEPWSSQLNKFIDWLFSLVESPEECWSAASISTVRAALLSLRSCAEFQKKAVWTRAYGW